MQTHSEGSWAGSDDLAAVEAFRHVWITLVHAGAGETGRSDRAGLTLRQFAILLASDSDPEPQTVRGLAAQLHVSRSSVTLSVDQLSAMGLVERQPDPRDRRSILIAPTPAGAVLVDSMTQAMDQRLRNAASAAGRIGGRQPVVTTDKLRRARELVGKGLSVRDAAVRLKVGKTALYEAMRAAEPEKGASSNPGAG